jgi:hypothetical protein
MVVLLAAVAIGSTVVALRLRNQSRLLAEGRNRVVDERNRALRLLHRAQEAERDKSRLLRESLLAQARAGRFSGRPGRRLERDQAHLAGCMAFSSDGRLLAVAHSSRDVLIVDSATLALVATLKAPDAHLISCLAFSPQGRFLAVGTENHVIQLWDLVTIRRGLADLGLPPATPLGEQPGPDTDSEAEPH